jgi:hypothetical protein
MRPYLLLLKPAVQIHMHLGHRILQHLQGMTPRQQLSTWFAAEADRMAHGSCKQNGPSNMAPLHLPFVGQRLLTPSQVCADVLASGGAGGRAPVAVGFPHLHVLVNVSLEHILPQG